MDRRVFLFSSLATTAVVAAPRLGFAQQRLRRIALVSPTVPVEEITEVGVRWRFMMLELRRVGLVEGQNILFERHSGMNQQAATSNLVLRWPPRSQT